ncbi:hypothetical protein [Streptomyces rubradiris]|uniref:Uncharacterized protein n=1 Tax=Streptomyces rubradiris TaxID=285531 RepID=A0ABQ3R3G2_STRRR|nr:hypothetical protein [Streptomyces rubradiris]GHH30108.1 hypothetical protein GCM10018792_76120 [Streptomyces rubradiris]GHI50393.1 hypothetical protein Srubr_02390 [Streptomyces rubradiris]
MTEQQIRDILRPYRDGGSISRLYATGEISEHTIPALVDLMASLDLDDRDTEIDQIHDVIDYVTQVGCRPPVTRWTTAATREQK